MLTLQGVDNPALPGATPAATPAAAGISPSATPLPSSPAQVWYALLIGLALSAQDLLRG